MDSQVGNYSFYVIGLSYKKADVAIRSTFSLDFENRKALLTEAKETGLPGIMVVSTCNRTEIAGFAQNPFQLISLLCKYSKGTVDEFAGVSYVYKSAEAIKHYMKIATGLDSQILGDYEIVGQLKGAFNEAKDAGTINAFLERLFNVSLHASKEVKNKTSLSSGTTTVSYAAIQYIKTQIEEYSDKSILIYGLGEIGKNTVKSCVEYLSNNNISVINRTDSKAINISKTLGVEYIPHKDLKDYARSTDILIVATGAPQSTIDETHLDPGKEQLIIDISIPSNVDTKISSWQNKEVINVDMLSEKTGKTLKERKNQIPMAEAIVESYKDEFYEWLHFRKHAPAIHSLKNALGRIKDDIIYAQQKKNPDLNIEQVDNTSSLFLNKVVSKFARYLKENPNDANDGIKVMEQIFK